MLTGIIRGQRLMLRTPIVVADSINYLTAKFAFDADWKGRVITAYFVCGDKTITAELTSGEITAAQGINLTAGRWELKLSGIKADSRVTAGPVWFDVLPFGAADGELPDISLTQYEQLLAKNRRHGRSGHRGQEYPCSGHKRGGAEWRRFRWRGIAGGRNARAGTHSNRKRLGVAGRHSRPRRPPRPRRQERR